MSPIPLGILAASGVAAAAAYDLLETTTLSSNTNTVTFTGLGSYSDYKHLQVRISGGIYFSTSGTFYRDYRLTFNGDNGTNYAWGRLGRFGSMTSFSSSPESTHVGSRNYIEMNIFPTQWETYQDFGSEIVDILDFSSTNKNTTIQGLGTYAASSFGGTYMRSGAWLNTSAVTSMTFTPAPQSPATVQWRAGSRFSLYGVK